MMPVHRGSAALAAACLAGSLGACTTPPTRVYSLEAVAPAAGPASAEVTDAPAGAPIRVDAVSVPPALDRSEIVSDEPRGRLRIHDLDHWPAPLGEAARQTLSADLDSRLAPGRLIFPHLPKPPDALGLSVDILSFHLDQGIARLEASWVISGPDLGSLRRTVTLRRVAWTTPPAPPTGTATLAAPDAAATASALGNLLADLADLIAASLTPADLRNSAAATGSEP
jgi:uncharacterized lipoprotein YmbA